MSDLSVADELKTDCMDALEGEGRAWDSFVDSATGWVTGGGDGATAAKDFGSWVHADEVSDTVCDVFDNSQTDSSKIEVDLDGFELPFF